MYTEKNRALTIFSIILIVIAGLRIISFFASVKYSGAAPMEKFVVDAFFAVMLVFNVIYLIACIGVLLLCDLSRKVLVIGTIIFYFLYHILAFVLSEINGLRFIDVLSIMGMGKIYYVYFSILTVAIVLVFTNPSVKSRFQELPDNGSGN